MTVTIKVDFNNLARNGKVVALPTWADGPVAVGQRVRAVDYDGLTFDAEVAEEDIESHTLYLTLGDELPPKWSDIPVEQMSDHGPYLCEGSGRWIPCRHCEGN
ncbi:hypothetical protein QNA24_22475 [Rhodococcus qingshengii]|uniref:hypothetical protein n=1 Tax=Rhodococcus qingshengii TaxID=334542 RepID=UPI0024BA36D7|nr:hypothetical protein [Rhodococcus qingshengii]MDJ0489144.1 hypothetical protein [Rhodococcus qingshengii]